MIWCEMQRAAVHLKLPEGKGRLPFHVIRIGPSPVSEVTGVGVKSNELLQVTQLNPVKSVYISEYIL